MELSGARRLNASELVTAALQALNADPGLLDQLRAQSRLFVLDDAQNVDPQTARLCALFVDSADCAVIAGDPEQAVFGFRGASEDFLLHHPVAHECRLDASLRVMTSREIVVADSVAAQSSAIADVVRREHLLGGRPWEDIAVIVRGAGEVEPMRRVLLGAGVPVSLDPTAVVLSEEHIVQAVLLAVRAARAGAVVPLGGQGAAVLEPLSRSEVVQLASGPVGGADPVVLRRVLRGVRKAELMRARAAGQGIGRRAVDCLADLLNCGQDAVLGLDALRDVLSVSLLCCSALLMWSPLGVRLCSGGSLWRWCCGRCGARRVCLIICRRCRCVVVLPVPRRIVIWMRCWRCLMLLVTGWSVARPHP